MGVINLEGERERANKRYNLEECGNDVPARAPESKRFRRVYKYVNKSARAWLSMQIAAAAAAAAIY